jgi:hypothetical protein
MIFVNPKMWPTSSISSTPLLVFGNDTNTCMVDSIILNNITNNLILVTLTIAREVEVGQEKPFEFGSAIPLRAYERTDALLNMALTMEPGDLLYANSDYSENLFNTFVNYRQLTET